MNNNEKTEIYEKMISNIPIPNNESKIWSNIPNKLSVCLIEFRCHKYIEKVLHNMSNIYGGTDVMLYIIHGNENEKYIQDIIYDWENVKLIKLAFDNINIEIYNQLLTNHTLYDIFKTEYVLIFQTDTLIRKKIPSIFFNYSYVGAPWQGYPNDFPDNPQIRLGNKLVGNGGFSLRHVQRMKKLLSIHKREPHSKLNEDVFISNHLSDDEVPTVEIAKGFSVEWVYDKDPVGLHHVWTIFPLEIVKQWLEVLYQ
jgi:hypothetical protein